MHYAFVLPVKNEENTIKEIIEKNYFKGLNLIINYLFSV